MNKCIDCDVEYEIGRRKRCLPCARIQHNKWAAKRRLHIREYQAARRLKTKKYLVELAGGQCKVCGFNNSHFALDFHHVDSSKKDFNLGKTNKPLDLLMEELTKCVLLCANCHRMVHSGEIKIGA